MLFYVFLGAKIPLELAKNLKLIVTVTVTANNDRGDRVLNITKY